MGSDSVDVLERIDAEQERYLEELKDYIRIPSISTDPDYKSDVLRAAEFLAEGEEEAGGQSIDDYVRQDGGKKLAADCVVISDSSLFAPGQPSLIYGLKGLCYMEIKDTGPNRDLHSGTYGGAVWNPLNALCHIVDGLRDAETGKILIPGFYDDGRPLREGERPGGANV